MLDIAYKFKSMLYDSLSNNNFLQQNTKGIFFSIQQNANYPYILINNFKVETIYLHKADQYNIEFKISIFIRDETLTNLMKIGDNILNLVKYDAFNSKVFSVISINANSTQISQGHDLLTSKLELNYKLIIRQNP